MYKKIHGLVVIILIMGLLAGCNSKHIENDTEIIATYLDTCSDSTRYGLYDIDEDGHMELLTAENNSHADSVTIFAVDDKNHRLSELGSFGSWGSMLYYSGGYIVSGFTGQGIDETQIYKIADGKADVVHEFWDNSGTLDDEYVYKVDGESVSEEKYHELYKQYTSGEEISLGYNDFVAVDDYDIMYKTILNNMR